MGGKKESGKNVQFDKNNKKYTNKKCKNIKNKNICHHRHLPLCFFI